MLFPTLSGILLASAIGIEAVNVYKYASNNRGTMRMGGCTGLPERQCCRFTDSYSVVRGTQLITAVSATKSVRWQNMKESDVGSWFFPGPGSPCGRVRASVTGPNGWTCLSANGAAHRRDGAMWFHVLNYGTGAMQCPNPGIVQALPDHNFKVAMPDAAQKFNPIQGIKYPSGWGAMKKKSIAGRTVHEVSAEEAVEGSDAPKCEGVHYADTYIWGEGDSVYILKGSEEVHDALNRYHAAPQPKQPYIDFVKSLGAEFYSDWRDNEDLRQDINGTQAEKHMAAEKRQDFPQIDATQDAAGAGDAPENVKDTLN